MNSAVKITIGIGVGAVIILAAVYTYRRVKNKTAATPQQTPETSATAPEVVMDTRPTAKAKDSVTTQVTEITPRRR